MTLTPRSCLTTAAPAAMNMEELPCEETFSVVELRWRLRKYFHPLERDSEDVSSRNIFRSTADGLPGQNPVTGIPRHQVAHIAAETMQTEFNLAGWPCPGFLAECADMLIQLSARMPKAPLAFSINAQQQGGRQKDTQQVSAHVDREAAAFGQHAGKSDQQMSSAAGSKAAASASQALADSHTSELVQFVLTPFGPKSPGSNVSLEAWKASVAGASLLRATQQHDDKSGEQSAAQMSMADLRALDVLAEIHSRTSLLATASLDAVLQACLPSGMSIRQLIGFGIPQIDLLSMRMHAEEHGPIPAVASATGRSALSIAANTTSSLMISRNGNAMDGARALQMAKTYAASPAALPLSAAFRRKTQPSASSRPQHSIKADPAEADIAQPATADASLTTAAVDWQQLHDDLCIDHLLLSAHADFESPGLLDKQAGFKDAISLDAATQIALAAVSGGGKPERTQPSQEGSQR